MNTSPIIHYRKSLRIKDFDYSASGAYFITICTNEKKCTLSKINDGRNFLSSIGKIVDLEWKRTAEIRTNVKLDEFVIMPNHIHGIIFLNNEGTARARKTGQACRNGEIRKTGIRIIADDYTFVQSGINKRI